MKRMFNFYWGEKLRTLLILLWCSAAFISSAYGQTVSVNVANTPSQLVNTMTNASSCAVVSNEAFSSPQSVAYFNNNGSSFPFSEGILIRSGNALHTQGAYTGQDLSSLVSVNGDPNLQSISDNSGQTSNITDVAFLEFDFVPNGPELSFNFIFASNEYGQWQCGFSDVFAFLLTDLTTGITTNLAVVPGTNNPISVRQIRDGAYNLACASVNEELFGVYNVNTPNSSTINMRGHTVAMNASSAVTPNTMYRLRLVIGDYNDADFDSAIFIESGSFNTSINLGEDQISCGEDITLDSQMTDIVNYSYEWRRNGATISGENSPTLTTDQTGIYDLLVTTISTGCVSTDQMEISTLQIGTPDNLQQCSTDTFFDLTENDEVRLGIDATRYELFYYNSLANANADIPIPSNQWTNYSSPSGETIYLRVRNRATNQFCGTPISFALQVINLNPIPPNPIQVCENESTINLPNEVEAQILNGLNPSEYTIQYYNSEDDANTNTSAIANPSSFPTPSSNSTLWARLSSIVDTNCFEVVSFMIEINSLPLVDNLNNVIECSSFTLPALTNGNYFSSPNGQGVQLNAGDVISSTSVIYIYNTSANGCSNQWSFVVNIIQSFSINTQHCGSFTIPGSSLGDFYTAPDGPNGTGTLLGSGTILTSSQTIYYYGEFNNMPCVDKQFDITIIPLPPVDSVDDVVTCNPYTLPALTNGNYYTGPNGSGTALNAGDVISQSSTLYVYNTDGTCTNEDSFEIVVIDVNSFQDVTACESYTIPPIANGVGAFFTQPGGAGSLLPIGTVINSSQTMYYYAETTDGPNCTDNVPINITINSLPPVSSLDDVFMCFNESYELPTIANGNYFTEPNGQGTQLPPGSFVSTNSTIYIYSENTFCSNETSFEVEIRPIPAISAVPDILVCEPFTLPVIDNGNYFTEPNGQGTQLFPGDVITTSQIIYIFSQDPIVSSCQSETQFEISILGITVDELPDAEDCSSYTLPALTVGDYFTEPNGQGTQLFPGDVITSTQTIYIYAENGDRFLCFDEHPFTVTISGVPALQNFPNRESCGSYTLETLNIPDVDVTYYRQPGGVNIIDPSEYTLSQPGIYTIHARLSNSNRPECFVDEVFSVTVYPLRELTINDATICVDPESGLTTRSAILESGLDPNEFTVEWYLDGTLMGTGPNYEATETGTYTVQTIKLTADVGADCNYMPTQVEVRASTPEARITLLTAPFDPLGNISVDIINPGMGTYIFRLNNGAFQQSNVFTDVPFGDHVITVRDTSGICNDLIIPYRSLGYRNFFTPNGDGINDTWNIPDLSTLTNSTIKIFDRYGRLVKELDPSGAGWDGISNNGDPLPSSSYWFRVEYTFQGVSRTLISYIALQRN